MGLGGVAALCQATGNVLTKLGSQAGDLSSVEVSVIRLVFGCVGLGVVVSVYPKIWPQFRVVFASRALTTRLLLASVLGTYLGIWLLVTALQHSPAGVAATLSAMSPIFVLPLVALRQPEQLGRRAIAGALLAVVGVGILSLWQP